MQDSLFFLQAYVSECRVNDFRIALWFMHVHGVWFAPVFTHALSSSKRKYIKELSIILATDS